MNEAEELVAKLKAERAAKLAKATNGRAEVITMRPAEKPKRVEAVRPKLEIAPPKASDDITAPLLERTLAALSKLDFSFSYDVFRARYHVGDLALQQRIGENIEHALLMLRTMIVSKFRFDPGVERIKAAVYRLCRQRFQSGFRLSRRSGVGWHAPARHLALYLSRSCGRPA